MKLTRFDIILNIWGSLIMSLVLSFALPMIANGSITLGGYVSGLMISFIVSMALKLFTPVIKLGDTFAAKCGAKPHTAGRQLLAACILAPVMGTIMSLTMTWWGAHDVAGYQSFFLSSWLTVYPWAILIVYVMINISLWTGIPMTRRLLGIPSGTLPQK